MDRDVFVRPLDPGDLEAFKAVRLRALKDHPELYATTYAESVERGDAYWHGTLSGGDKAVFGLFDAGTLIGIGSVFTFAEDPSRTTALFAMGYVDPEYRGRGYASLLFKARLDWVRGQGCFHKVRITHREGNAPIERVILAHGFVLAGREEHPWHDGSPAADMIYELAL